jgi:hypothetical protein
MAVQFIAVTTESVLAMFTHISTVQEMCSLQTWSAHGSNNKHNIFILKLCSREFLADAMTILRRRRSCSWAEFNWLDLASNDTVSWRNLLLSGKVFTVLKLIKLSGMKTYGGMKIHITLTSALDRGVTSALRSCRFNLSEWAWGTHCFLIGGLKAPRSIAHIVENRGSNHQSSVIIRPAAHRYRDRTSL